MRIFFLIIPIDFQGINKFPIVQQFLFQVRVKMVQRFTSDLPKHLASNARDQIRNMSKSDHIYEFKNHLTEHNRSKAEMDKMQDTDSTFFV